MLSDNKIGDGGLKAFANAVSDGVSFQKLRKLYLDRNEISDEGAIALAEVWKQGLHWSTVLLCSSSLKPLTASGAPVATNLSTISYLN